MTGVQIGAAAAIAAAMAQTTAVATTVAATSVAAQIGATAFIVSNPIGWAVGGALALGAIGYGIYQYAKPSPEQAPLQPIPKPSNLVPVVDPHEEPIPDHQPEPSCPPHLWGALPMHYFYIRYPTGVPISPCVYCQVVIVSDFQNMPYQCIRCQGFCHASCVQNH